MMRRLGFALVLAGCVGLHPGLLAQSAAGGDKAAAENKPASDGQKQPTVANPFPEDTSTVPVLTPSEPGAAAQGSSYGADRGTANQFFALPSEDSDPVRSPDDAAPAPSDGGGDGAGQDSSSLAGVDALEPVPDTEQPEKKRKRDREVEVKEPTHQEAASKDIEVGSYYLDRKDWKAALSRFESAMVLDPENPEVYWGLGEAERNLGRYAEARKNFETLLEYDPDGKHGKQVRKLMKEPALAAAHDSGPAGGPEAAQK